MSPSPSEAAPVYKSEPPAIFRNRMIFNRETSIRQGLSVLIGRQRIPSWNISGRPKKAKKGTLGFNMQTNRLEYWDGVKWLSMKMSGL